MRSEIHSDPLSQILRLLDARPVVTGGFSAGGAWAVRFPQPDKIKFFALIKGSCWLCIDDDAKAVRISQGDIFLLSGERPFVLASSPDVPPVDALSLFRGSSYKTATLGHGEDCVQIGGHIRLDRANSAVLIDGLPPLIHVNAKSDEAKVLQWLMERLVRELASDRPGNSLAATQLVQLMFIEVLRTYLDNDKSISHGWLRAVGDRRLGPALQLMHATPSRAWRLEELATASAMSRTAFAVHFKAVAGMAPLKWLTLWRMRMARRRLSEEDTPIAVIAAQLGYASESAFSNAFKRVMGEAPRYYRTADHHAKQGPR